MNRKLQIKAQSTWVAAFLLTVLMTAPASAQLTDEYYLAAQQFTRTMPGGEVITFWGFARYQSDFTTLIREPNIPGPMLEVGYRENTLTVHLRNDLTEPISLVIPSLPAVMDPNFFMDDQGRRRVRSFTYETHPGQTRQYTWPDLRAGTFLYHSGTHPAVQVQMGLYGGLKVYWNPWTESYQGINVDSSADLFFSEVDPSLHNAVATGNYGPGKAVTSTIDYEPKYFLINGEPYSEAAMPVLAGNPEDTILLRFLNAGLESHVPVIHGLYMDIIAEDGYVYPFERRQYSMLLAAGQTKDALIIPPPGDAIYPLYDRMLNLTNNADSPGGMIAKLQVGTVTPNTPPVITSITATPALIPPGACSTQLSVTTAADPDGPEGLIYSWTAQGCIGSFDSPGSQTTIYNFPEGLPPGPFTFTVYVSDGADTTQGAVDVTIQGQPEPDLIIDNRDAGASSTGTWLLSGGANPWGEDSVYSDTAGDTFTFQGARNGENNVYMRWTAWPSRYNAVPVEIFDNTTSLGVFTVDQTANAGTWVLLPGGPYTFTGTAKVVITVDHGTSQSTNADAVRFTSMAAAFVDHIEIVGPTTVGDEQAPVNYDIRVVNSDGTSSMTDPQIWDVVDTGTSIDAAGTLTVPNVTADLPATISAEYTAAGCIFTDTLDITIVDGVVAIEVIVDNRDANTSQTGVWTVSGGVDPWGTDSVYNRTAGDTFSFHTDLAGVPYAVYMRWTGWSSRRSSVPVEISANSALLDTVTVNQQQNPSMWNLLGIYTLGPNTEMAITSLDSGGSTNADAVKFTPVAMLTEIIVDNGGVGTSATAGTWSVSGGANPYGSNSLWSRSVDGTYTYHIANLTGTFDVYAWWTEWESRSTSVPIEIWDGGTLETTVNVDQLANGGRWNLLSAGMNFLTDVKIVIVSENADFSTNADAIRLVPVP